jgi:hypothetical protein
MKNTIIAFLLTALSLLVGFNTLAQEELSVNAVKYDGYVITFVVRNPPEIVPLYGVPAKKVLHEINFKHQTDYNLDRIIIYDWRTFRVLSEFYRFDSEK